jgi:RND family efflux transporter MFP subunit
MADPRVSLGGVLVAASVLLVLGGAALFWSAPDPQRVAASVEAARGRAVRTQPVRALPVRARIERSGVLEARRSVDLYAETRGPVLEVGAEALDRVEPGQLLVALDPLEAEVAVERAAATLARSESELALARSNLERRRSLARQSVASDADLEDAENAEKVAVAVLRQSRAELERARDELARKTIAAPFAGVLREFDVEQGEYVSEGQRLGELLDLSTARVRIGLSDREVVSVRPGAPAELRVEAYAGEVVSGEILRVGAAADPVNKKFPVEIEVPNAEGRLLPGMVASVALSFEDPAPRIVVPREATVDEFGLRAVWVIEADGDGLVARRRRIAVRPLPFRPGEFEVTSGLREGEEIAVSATRQLREGDRVVRQGGSQP